MTSFKRALSTLLLSVALTGCSAVAENSPAANDQIVAGLTLEPIGFYPLRALDSGSYYAQTLVYEGLVRYGPNLNVVPALAKEFSVSPDGLTYSFVLRDQLRFSDGSAITLDDILASLELAKSKSSPFKADYVILV